MVCITGAMANAAEHVFPGDATWPVAINLVEPPIQFLALGVRQRDGLRCHRETLPEVIQ